MAKGAVRHETLAEQPEKASCSLANAGIIFAL
jgi:hypothetical protein